MRSLLRESLVAGIYASLLAVTAAGQSPSPATITRQIPWTGHGVWLPADLHVHTRFSDGGLEFTEVADRASRAGCQVLAITDHSDRTLRAATPEYQAAIANVKAAHPDLLVLTGLEWNIPPGHGRDHAVVLFPDDDQQPAVMAEFKRRFDDFERPAQDSVSVQEAFDWLAARYTGRASQPVVFISHPLRKLPDGTALLSMVRQWATPTGLLVGFEGGPGYQMASANGVYDGAMKLQNRWDPLAADVGGAWDTLTAQGLAYGGSLANSDFHDPGEAYWPCEFSRTLIYARDRSAGAVLDALRARSYIGVHGNILKRATLTANAKGLGRPAAAGEMVLVDPGVSVDVTLAAEPSERDWKGQPGVVEALEIIAIDANGAHVVAHGAPDAAGVLTTTITVPQGGIALRGRGHGRSTRPVDTWWFYTNVLRVSTQAGRSTR